MSVVCGDDARTLDMSELLEHIRKARRSREPHPVYVMLIVAGSLLLSCALWGLLIVMLALAWFGV